MMTEELKAKTRQWFIDRNLQEANPVKQFIKLMEESGELFEGLAKGKADLIEDALGDMQVVLIGLALQLENGNQLEAGPQEMDLLALVSNLGVMAGKLYNHLFYRETLGPRVNAELLLVQSHIHALAIHSGTQASDCLAVAYDEIKDRKGRLINGVFVKEADLVGQGGQDGDH